MRRRTDANDMAVWPPEPVHHVVVEHQAIARGQRQPVLQTRGPGPGDGQVAGAFEEPVVHRHRVIRGHERRCLEPGVVDQLEGEVVDGGCAKERHGDGVVHGVAVRDFHPIQIVQHLRRGFPLTQKGFRDGVDLGVGQPLGSRRPHPLQHEEGDQSVVILMPSPRGPTRCEDLSDRSCGRALNTGEMPFGLAVCAIEPRFGGLALELRGGDEPTGLEVEYAERAPAGTGEVPQIKLRHIVLALVLGHGLAAVDERSFIAPPPDRPG